MPTLLNELFRSERKSAVGQDAQADGVHFFCCLFVCVNVVLIKYLCFLPNRLVKYLISFTSPSVSPALDVRKAGLSGETLRSSVHQTVNTDRARDGKLSSQSLISI